MLKYTIESEKLGFAGNSKKEEKREKEKKKSLGGAERWNLPPVFGDSSQRQAREVRKRELPDTTDKIKCACSTLLLSSSPWLPCLRRVDS